MESPKCQVRGCDGKVEVEIVRAAGYTQVEDTFWCAPHAVELLGDLACELDDQMGGTGSRVDASAVDIERVVCDGRDGCSCQVVLRELNGSRRLAFPTGRFEAWMLAWELKHVEAARPNTHRAMVSALGSLGGVLQKVTINDVSEGETYHAQLQIAQGGRSVVVDIRPSDALVLAVICNIGIFVDTLVWDKTS